MSTQTSCTTATFVVVKPVADLSEHSGFGSLPLVVGLLGVSAGCESVQQLVSPRSASVGCCTKPTTAWSQKPATCTRCLRLHLVWSAGGQLFNQTLLTSNQAAPWLSKAQFGLSNAERKLYSLHTSSYKQSTGWRVLGNTQHDAAPWQLFSLLSMASAV